MRKTNVPPGTRFGRLVVVGEGPRTRNENRRTLQCRCDCGNTSNVIIRDLIKKRKPTMSCGCLARESARALLVTHGLSKHPLYEIWHGVVKRCTDSSSGNYSYYGGRGITVCQEWHDVENFHAWAIENGWEPGLEIDRIDDNGQYCPSNCRFVTRSENMRNTRANHNLTLNGITRCIIEWSEITGIKYRTILSRKRYGWSDEKTLTTAVHGSH